MVRTTERNEVAESAANEKNFVAATPIRSPLSFRSKAPQISEATTRTSPIGAALVL
jgi:hypothetical protein